MEEQRTIRITLSTWCDNALVIAIVIAGVLIVVFFVLVLAVFSICFQGLQSVGLIKNVEQTIEVLFPLIWLVVLGLFGFLLWSIIF